MVSIFFRIRSLISHGYEYECADRGLAFRNTQ